MGPTHDFLTSIVMSPRTLAPVAMASRPLSSSYESASTSDRTPVRQLVANEPTRDNHRDGRYQLRHRNPPNPRADDARDYALQ
jgi:hypothetical protein